MRLLDVFAIGPLMALGGWRLRDEYPLLGTLLGVLGISTIVYNGRNYLRIKKNTMVWDWNPEYYNALTVMFQRPRPPYRRPNGPELKLYHPNRPETMVVGLNHRTCLPTNVGLLLNAQRMVKVKDVDRKIAKRSGELGLLSMAKADIPLSVAFVDKSARIIAIRKMPAPRSNAIVTPPKGTVWAIEANQGWFRTNGVQVGDVAIGLNPYQKDYIPLPTS